MSSSGKSENVKLAVSVLFDSLFKNASQTLNNLFTLESADSNISSGNGHTLNVRGNVRKNKKSLKENVDDENEGENIELGDPNNLILNLSDVEKRRLINNYGIGNGEKCLYIYI
jgi:hypothetical protein